MGTNFEPLPFFPSFPYLPIDARCALVIFPETGPVGQSAVGAHFNCTLNETERGEITKCLEAHDLKLEVRFHRTRVITETLAMMGLAPEETNWFVLTLHFTDTSGEATIQAFLAVEESLAQAGYATTFEPCTSKDLEDYLFPYKAPRIEAKAA